MTDAALELVPFVSGTAQKAIDDLLHRLRHPLVRCARRGRAVHARAERPALPLLRSTIPNG